MEAPLPKGCAVVTHHARRRQPSPTKPTCIDLFAGAGGLAEGFRQAGYSILAGVDDDAAAAQTFLANFAESSFFQCSVADVAGKDLLYDAALRPGQLDVLIGGPPCQSFSYNNHARSTSGARSKLFRDYLRLVEALLPKYIVMENVPGILTIGKGKVLKEIIKSLGKLGYECEARILYAEDFGVPQERRRVFFIGSRLGWDNSLFPAGSHGPAPKPSIEANSFVHRWEPGRRKVKRFVTVWEAIGDLPSLKNGQNRPDGPHRRKAREGYQTAMRAKSDTLFNHVGRNISRRMLRRIETVPEGGNWRDIPRRLLPAGMKRARKSDHTKRYGRLAKRGLACTILTKCDPHWGAYVHPTDDRAITVREAARLQSFPDSFQFKGTPASQYMQVGNAVPPLMARAVARAVRAHSRRVRLLAMPRRTRGSRPKPLRVRSHAA
jgi:DNA (cytosine-5)-methyltransferase 1